jgi:hypothetical protein
MNIRVNEVSNNAGEVQYEVTAQRVSTRLVAGPYPFHLVGA